MVFEWSCYLVHLILFSVFLSSSFCFFSMIFSVSCKFAPGCFPEKNIFHLRLIVSVFFPRCFCTQRNHMLACANFPSVLYPLLLLLLFFYLRMYPRFIERLCCGASSRSSRRASASDGFLLLQFTGSRRQESPAAFQPRTNSYCRLGT